MSASDVVTAFIQAIERMDVKGASTLLADDVSYENVPMSPVPGREATRAVSERFVACSRIEWPVKRQMSSGNSVMNERVDRFEINGTWVELPVVGVFEVNDDDRITLWHDYFDLETYMRQMAPHRPGARLRLSRLGTHHEALVRALRDHLLARHHSRGERRRRRSIWVSSTSTSTSSPDGTDALWLTHTWMPTVVSPASRCDCAAADTCPRSDRSSTASTAPWSAGAAAPCRR